MREGIGSIMLYNIIIVFISLIFAIIAGTVSYAKAFKVNAEVAKVIEMYGGYNLKPGVNEELTRILSGLGYRIGSNKKTCGKTWKGTGVLMNTMSNVLDYELCIYKFRIDSKGYNRYGIVTYMHLDLPVLGDLIRVPIYSSTKKIYYF